MSRPARRSGSFDNHGSGIQNAKVGDGSQINNNSGGTQYNTFYGHGHSAILKDMQGQDPAEIDNNILRSLAFPHMWDRRDNIESCHPNTCQWILELDDYKSWRSQSRGLLWIKGKPGAGKSTLMAFLYDELRKSPDRTHGLRLEFFFTARGSELQRTPLGMLRSLLNQVLKLNATVCSELREAYMQRCRDFGYGEDKWQWPRVLLEQLLQNAILRLAAQQQVTIFVDALDEAGEESARKLAGYFHQLNDHATKNAAMLKICISCRHYPIMANSGTTEITVEKHNDNDIAMYIKGHLPDEILAIDGPHQEDWKDLIETLIKQASGVFQWAHIVMPLIRGKIDDGRSPEDIRHWLPNVPAGLEDVYQYILAHVIKREDQAQSFQFFQWVCLAEQPLTVTEMRYALVAHSVEVTQSSVQWEKVDGFIATDERMHRLTKTLSGGLAEVIKGHDRREIVQVVHQSVNEFLRTKGLIGLSRLIGSAALPVENRMILCQCQAMLYRSCLVYLATTEIPRKSQQEIQHSRKEVLIKNGPFLSYATLSVSVHAEKAAEYRSFGLAEEIQILQTVVDRWVDLYQEFDRYKAGCPPAGTTVLHMAAAANMADVVASLASDSGNITKVDGDGDTAFHSAARWGHVKVGEIFLERGVEPDTTCAYGETALVKAASRGHVGFVEWLLREGASINTTRGSSGSALQAASLEGKVTIVRMLLGTGADVNAQGGEYGNALQAASYKGSAEVVQMLLDAKADVNAQGGFYGNALQAASYDGSAEVVKILLDAKADVNAQGGEYGNALQAASWRGSAEVVKMLLDAKADVNAQGGKYGNALQAASYKGSAEVVQMLLDAKADVNAQGGHFGNALQAASYSYKGSAEVVKILLDAKADVNAQGGHFGNALQAASYKGRAEVVKILLDAKADVNAQGGHFGNALQAASYKGRAEVVKMLLDAKADVNAQGGHFGNALQAASNNGSAEVVKMLLDAKADVNAQGGRYGTALLAAAHRPFPDRVDILLQAGANPNLLDTLHRSFLHIAATRAFIPILRQSSRLSSTINTPDIFSQTPLHLAVVHGHTDFALALLELGANPLMRDAYGRNTLDWAVDHPLIATRLHDLFPEIAQTDHEVQLTAVRRSICQISNTLFSSSSDPSSPLIPLLRQLASSTLVSMPITTSPAIFVKTLFLELAWFADSVSIGTFACLARTSTPPMADQIPVNHTTSSKCNTSSHPTSTPPKSACTIFYGDSLFSLVTP
ncbi:hypothetical protein N7488_004456 [Penicillium malachiteum]|nr:hypothetical protein N7488_004456 [Penicillium malachiteum]